MPPTPFSVRSRRAVDARIAGLEAEFGSFPVVDWTAVNHPDYFDRGVDVFEAGHRGGAAVCVTDDDRRLLFIRQPRRPETGVFPGGSHESGESFPETARREVWEETGVDCELTGVWRAVRKRYVDDDDPARRLLQKI